jgi:hypothetical protein
MSTHRGSSERRQVCRAGILTLPSTATFLAAALNAIHSTSHAGHSQPRTRTRTIHRTHACAHTTTPAGGGKKKAKAAAGAITSAGSSSPSVGAGAAAPQERDMSVLPGGANFSNDWDDEIGMYVAVTLSLAARFCSWRSSEWGGRSAPVSTPSGCSCQHPIWLLLSTPHLVARHF